MSYRTAILGGGVTLTAGALAEVELVFAIGIGLVVWGMWKAYQVHCLRQLPH